MSRCTVVSSIVTALLGWKVKAWASRGRGDGVLLREALLMRSLAMSRSPFGGSWRKWCAVSDVLVCRRVAGRLASSGVAGFVSAVGECVSAGLGSGVDALPQKKDMERECRGNI